MDFNASDNQKPGVNATPEEMAEAALSQLVSGILRNIPTSALQTELKRRGMLPEKKALTLDLFIGEHPLFTIESEVAPRVGEKFIFVEEEVPPKGVRALAKKTMQVVDLTYVLEMKNQGQRTCTKIIVEIGDGEGSENYRNFL